jgi:hypothetical protein
MEYLLRRDKQKPHETFVRGWPTKTSVNREHELYFAGFDILRVVLMKTSSF